MYFVNINFVIWSISYKENSDWSLKRTIINIKFSSLPSDSSTSVIKWCEIISTLMSHLIEQKRPCRFIEYLVQTTTDNYMNRLGDKELDRSFNFDCRKWLSILDMSIGFPFIGLTSTDLDFIKTRMKSYFWSFAILFTKWIQTQILDWLF